MKGVGASTKSFFNGLLDLVGSRYLAMNQITGKNSLRQKLSPLRGFRTNPVAGLLRMPY